MKAKTFRSTGALLKSPSLKIKPSVGIYLLLFGCVLLTGLALFPVFKSLHQPVAFGVTVRQGYPKNFDIFLSAWLMVAPPILFLLVGKMWGRFFETKPAYVVGFFPLRILNWFSWQCRKANVFLKRNRWLVWTLVLLVIALKSTMLAGAIFPADRYHFGELLNPSYFWTQFGQVPFKNVLPGHGLLNYAPGFIAEMAGDYSLKSVFASAVLVNVGLTLLSLILMQTIVKEPLLVMIGGLMVYELKPMYILTLLSFVAWYGFFQRPRWILALVLAGVVLFLVPWEFSTGIATAASTAVASVFFVASGFRSRRIDKDFWCSTACLLLPAAVGLGALAHPESRSLLVHALQDLRVLGKYNLDGFGTRWSDALNDGLLFTLLKFSFIPVCGFFILLIAQRRLKVAVSLRASLVAPVVFCFAILNYSMGRIDSGGLSRAGVLSLLLLALSLIVFYRSYFRTYAYKTLLVVCAWVAAGAAVTDIAEYRTFVRNYEIASNLQKNFPEMQEFRALKSEYDLRPFEFLDLTNNNLSYFFLELPSPLVAGSLYNSVAKSQWVSSYQNLRTARVIAVRSPYQQFHDGLSLADRSPEFAAELIQDCHFTVVSRGLYIYLVKETACTSQYDAEKRRLLSTVL